MPNLDELEANPQGSGIDYDDIGKPLIMVYTSDYLSYLSS